MLEYNVIGSTEQQIFENENLPELERDKANINLYKHLNKRLECFCEIQRTASLLHTERSRIALDFITYKGLDAEYQDYLSKNNLLLTHVVYANSNAIVTAGDYIKLTEGSLTKGQLDDRIKALDYINAYKKEFNLE